MGDLAAKSLCTDDNVNNIHKLGLRSRETSGYFEPSSRKPAGSGLKRYQYSE